MRQESKLSFVKRISRCSNYKNVAKTVAKKHQLWQCYKLQVERTYLYTDYESSPIKDACVLQAESEHIIKEISRLFPSVDSDYIVEHTNWIQLQSSLYRKGVYLLLRYDVISPEFGKIVDIMVVNELFSPCKFFPLTCLNLITTLLLSNLLVLSKHCHWMFFHSSAPCMQSTHFCQVTRTYILLCHFLFNFCKVMCQSITVL